MLTLTHLHPDEIDVIRDLWERNRLHHVAVSAHFSEEYVNIRFEDRMRPLMALPAHERRITAAYQEGTVCGYCISTAREGAGELVSLHVLEDARGQGVGRMLTENHLQWFRESGCTEISVQVAVENASTIEFYQRVGFRSNYVTMQWKGDL